MLTVKSKNKCESATVLMNPTFLKVCLKKRDGEVEEGGHRGIMWAGRQGRTLDAVPTDGA